MKTTGHITGRGAFASRSRRSRLRGAAAMALGLVLIAPWEMTLAAGPGKVSPKPAEAKRKPWSNAWAPKDKPLRGIFINFWHALQGGELREPWRGFCERNGLAWCEGGENAFDALGDLAWIFHAQKPVSADGPVVRPDSARLGVLRMNVGGPRNRRTYFSDQVEHKTQTQYRVSLSCVVSRYHFLAAG